MLSSLPLTWSFVLGVLFFFKQKTAYEMRISDWSSDVCSSDLASRAAAGRRAGLFRGPPAEPAAASLDARRGPPLRPVLRRAAVPGHRPHHGDRKSVGSGKSVSVRVDLGGRRIIKKKTQ